MKVITILEADVADDHVATLESEYEKAIAEGEAGIDETFLARDAKNPSAWRIVTVWESREALAAMRASGSTPRGVLIFRAAGAEPKLTMLEVSRSMRS